MTDNRLLRIAVELQLLGVSQRGVTELFRDYSPEAIEQQLAYLPYRKKPRRPEAFIIEAVRNNYSAPKEFFYAQAQPSHPGLSKGVDQSPELPH